MSTRDKARLDWIIEKRVWIRPTLDLWEVVPRGHQLTDRSRDLRQAIDAAMREDARRERQNGGGA